MSSVVLRSEVQEFLANLTKEFMPNKLQIEGDGTLTLSWRRPPKDELYITFYNDGKTALRWVAGSDYGESTFTRLGYSVCRKLLIEISQFHGCGAKSSLVKE